MPLTRRTELTPPYIKNNLTLKKIDGQRVLCWWNEGRPTLQDQHEKSILHWAIEMDNEQLAHYLINKDHQFFDDLDHNNRDPLECAIVHGNLNIIKSLLAAIHDLSVQRHKKLTTYFLEDGKNGRIRLIESFNDLCERSTHTPNQIALIFNALKATFFQLIPQAAQKEMTRIKYQINNEEFTMPAKKRKFTPELTADELYNKSIDFADKADRLFQKNEEGNDEKYFNVRKYFQKALEYASQAQAKYISLGQHQHAETTQHALIDPFIKKIAWLTDLTQAMEAEVIAQHFFDNNEFKRAEEEARLSIKHYQALILPDSPDSNQDVEHSIQKLQTTIRHCKAGSLSICPKHSAIEAALSQTYAIVTPDIVAPYIPPNVSPEHRSSFFQAPPSSLAHLRSLTHISALEELPFFTGDTLATVKEIQTRLMHIKKNLVLRIADTSDANEKMGIATQLDQLGLDFSTKLVSWSLSAPVETSNQEQLNIALQLLLDAKSILKSTQAIYKLLDCGSKRRASSLQYESCALKETELKTLLSGDIQEDTTLLIP